MRDRLEAEIATLRQLISEAISIDDIMGTHSLKSRLKAVEDEYKAICQLNNLDYNDFIGVSDSHYSAYSDEHDEEQKESNNYHS